MVLSFCIQPFLLYISKHTHVDDEKNLNITDFQFSTHRHRSQQLSTLHSFWILCLRHHLQHFAVRMVRRLQEWDSRVLAMLLSPIQHPKRVNYTKWNENHHLSSHYSISMKFSRIFFNNYNIIISSSPEATSQLVLRCLFDDVETFYVLCYMLELNINCIRLDVLLSFDFCVVVLQ